MGCFALLTYTCERFSKVLNSPLCACLLKYFVVSMVFAAKLLKLLFSQVHFFWSCLTAGNPGFLVLIFRFHMSFLHIWIILSASELGCRLVLNMIALEVDLL